MKLNKMKMHPLIILENIMASFIFIFALGLAFLTELIIEKELNNFLNFNIIIIFIIFIGIISFLALLSWHHTHIYIDNFFHIETGKLLKKHIKININDIAAISTKKNILERIFNVSSVKVELNTGVDDTINQKIILKDSYIEKINKIVLGKHELKKNSLVSYSNIDIFNHLFLSSNILSIILGIIITFGILFYLIEEGNNIFVILITGIIIFLGYVWNFVKKYFDYHNFNLSQEDNKIKISYGLFSKRTFEIPKEKINAIIISQSLQARIFNKYVINIVNAGIGNEEDEKTILCLYSSKENIDELIKKLFPDFLYEGKKINQTPQALTVYLINKMPFIFIVATLCLWYSKMLLLIDLIFIIIAIIQYKTKSLELDKKLIISKTGLFNKKVTIIKYSKITKVDFVDTLIGGLYHIKYLKISTVGAIGEHIFKLGYYSSRIENKIINSLK